MATMVDSPTNPARREPTPRVAPCTLGMRTQRPFVTEAKLRHTQSQSPAEAQEGPDSRAAELQPTHGPLPGHRPPHSRLSRLPPGLSSAPPTPRPSPPLCTRWVSKVKGMISDLPHGTGDHGVGSVIIAYRPDPGSPFLEWMSTASRLVPGREQDMAPPSEP